MGKRKSEKQTHHRRFKNQIAAKLTVALVHYTWRSWRWLLTEAFPKRTPQTVVWKILLHHHRSNVPSQIHTLHRITHHTKPWTTPLQSSKSAIGETRIKMDASYRHTYVCNVTWKFKSHFWDAICLYGDRISMCESCNDWVERFEAVKYKLSHELPTTTQDNKLWCFKSIFFR